MIKHYIIISIGLFNLLFGLRAQESRIKINGKVYDPDNPSAYYSLMIINKTTQHGILGEPDGSFTVYANKNDTIIIGCMGYQTTKITFADSIYKEEYNVKIPLQKLSITLKQIEVFAPRDLDKILSDIERLGYNKNDYVKSGIDAAQSPITFLYQQFSRRERSIRKVAELQNEDKKRELLKELFQKYVDYNIINLTNEQFDAFIDFCNVSDDFLKYTSQYDFIMYIKYKFNQFINQQDYYSNPSKR
ncbi:MAG: hypothetical protein ACK4IK_08495 [Bacteroidia bacterium]